MKTKLQATRREFLQQSVAAGAVLALSGYGGALAAATPRPGTRIKSRGYAAFDASGTLRPWEFERRPVGDHDILIDIKYASICHSDIHQLKGDWGPQGPAPQSWPTYCESLAPPGALCLAA